MSNKKVVELFYDVVSPYSRFAFEILCRYKSHWNMDLKLRPFYLGGVMQGADNQPPATNARKAMYMKTDLQRYSQQLGIPHRNPQDMDATEPASLKEASLKAGMTEALIQDALTRMNSPEIKERLKATTQKALDLGCFGAPFIVAHVNEHEETFFGADRFPMLAMVMGEQWKGPNPEQPSKL